jgi:hypothetical protein
VWALDEKPATAASRSGEDLQTQYEAQIEALNAQSKDLQQHLLKLQEKQDAQDRVIRHLKARLRQWEDKKETRHAASETQIGSPAGGGVTAESTEGLPIEDSEMQTARGTGNANQPAVGQPRVGQAPPKTERKRPQVAAIQQVGGVLTPKGNLVIEPALIYQHSSVNRFNFLGVSFFDALLIGLVRAEDIDRELYSAQITGRYGITDRLEAEIRVPWIYRTDSSRTTNVNLPQAQLEVTDTDGNGLGDIEFALHYQINRGLNGWPFFVGNIRYKTDTGDGPFDVARTADGRERQLATGSGFQSIEPSLTVLYPSDPAVLFANVGYLYNFSEDVNQDLNVTGQREVSTNTPARQRIGNVSPGSTFRMSFGLGYALNERLSLTLGYKQDFIFGGDVEVTDQRNITRTTQTADLNIGSLLFGMGYAFNKRVQANLNLELGMTRDAPDVLMQLRIPITAYRSQP